MNFLKHSQAMAHLCQFLCLSLYDALSEAMLIVIGKFENEFDQDVILLPAIKLAHEEFNC